MRSKLDRRLLDHIPDLERRKISWSQIGAIASVRRDGKSVQLQHLHCRPDNGQWELSGPTVVKQIELLHNGTDIDHLSWSPNGQILAIADGLGRLSFLSLQIALNSGYVVRRAIEQNDDSLMAIVGLSWLSFEKQVWRLRRLHGMLADSVGAVPFTCHKDRWTVVVQRYQPQGIWAVAFSQYFGCHLCREKWDVETPSPGRNPTQMA